MIKKFIKIANIGKLLNCAATGDVEFKKLNIIYGENGSGKTTICAILKSLGAGKNDIIIGRKSLNTDHVPYIEIRHDGGIIKFKNNTWEAIKGNLVIFDSSFVSENIHAGQVVGHDQKTALHSYAIGEEGVRLADELQDCKATIFAYNAELTRIEKDIKSNIENAVRAYMDNLTLEARTKAMRFSFKSQPIEDFISITKDIDVDNKLDVKKNHISSLEKANEIKNKSLLQPLSLPELGIDEFVAILGTTLADISQEAEELIKQHIAQFLNEKGEQWLLYGFKHIHNGQCPFCKQGLEGIDLISQYQTYFNETYIKFKSDVVSKLEDIKRRLDSQNLMPIQRSLDSNIALLEYWRHYIEQQPCFPATLFEKLQAVWNSLASAVFSSIEQKRNNLLQKIETNDDFKKAMLDLDDVRLLFTEYNSQVKKSNHLISEKKEKVEGGDIATEVSEVYMLLVNKYRHEKNVDALCEKYRERTEQLKSLNQQKNKSKALLETVTKDTLFKYQNGINRYLEIFGAEFKIVDKVSLFKGSALEPSIEYKIKIGNATIPLGDAKTTDDTPCFKNTLSEGDKSTLAFAFFMARLDMDVAISEKVIVLDDPTNSLDIHRRKATKQEIIIKANAAKQVIVLTHDPVFGKDIYDSDDFDKKQIKCLCVRKKSQESYISEWDILAETATEYFISYRMLEMFIDDGSGDILNVARSIRPVLEGHLRNCFPTIFTENKWLGNFIDAIKDAKDDSILKSLQGSPLQELININDYSKGFHHANVNPAMPNSTELKSYAKRTIDFLSR